MAAAIRSSSGGAGQEGRGHTEIAMGALPPAWVDLSDAAQADADRIKRKIAELESAHKKALMVTFDDTSDEHAVEVLTQEVSRLFKRAEGTLKKLGAVRDGSEKDGKMRKNVLVSIAGELQQLSQEFRGKQKDYLGKLRAQQAGPGGSVGLSNIDLGLSSNGGGGGGGGFFDDDPGFTDSQMLAVREQEGQVAERESEITSIMQSVNELAQVMRDLSVLVIDQGTILDRIDYNLQETAAHIDQGVVELEKAEKHRKASKMFLCIMLLAALCILMILVLAIKKIG